MTDLTNEIGDDYDQDNYGFDDPDLDIELENMEAMEDDLNRLMGATMAVESYGINPTAFAILKATDLLSGTSLNALAVEHFGYRDPENSESQMALEALTDKIKEKVASWSAKILSFTKSVTDKVTNSFSTLWSVIADTTKILASKTWDKAKTAATTIKAHPFKTVMAVLGAAVAVGAVVALVASGMPGAYANESALQSFVYKVSDAIGKIKWPGGKIVSKVNGMKIVYTVEGQTLTKVSETVDKLGWGQTAVKAASNQASAAWTAIRSGLGTIGSNILKVGKAINDTPGDVAAKNVTEKVANATGSKLGGWMAGETMKKMYGAAFLAIFGVLYKLLSNVAGRALQMVKDTFTSLKPAVQPV